MKSTAGDRPNITFTAGSCDDVTVTGSDRRTGALSDDAALTAPTARRSDCQSHDRERRMRSVFRRKLLYVPGRGPLMIDRVTRPPVQRVWRRAQNAPRTEKPSRGGQGFTLIPVRATAVSIGQGLGGAGLWVGVLC